MRTRRLILAVLLLVARCGSPSSPSKALNLAGTWSGTWQFVTSGVTVADNVTATLTQNGQDLSGTWQAESGASGTFSHLTPQPSTTGGLTISQTTLTGAVCSATTSFTGTASASTLDLTVAAIAPAGACQWAGSMQFTLRK